MIGYLILEAEKILPCMRCKYLARNRNTNQPLWRIKEIDGEQHLLIRCMNDKWLNPQPDKDISPDISLADVKLISEYINIVESRILYLFKIIAAFGLNHKGKIMVSQTEGLIGCEGFIRDERY
jgi:hypothetical protein